MTFWDELRASHKKFWDQFTPEEAAALKEYQRTAHLQHNEHVNTYLNRNVQPMWMSELESTRTYWRNKLGNTEEMVEAYEQYRKNITWK